MSQDVEPSRELHEAWRAFADAMLDSLRIPQMVDWLNRRLTR